MSFAATKWVSEQIRKGRLQKASPHARFVASAMADCHNGNNDRCFPSYEGLAKFTGYSRSTVARAIKELEEIGVIHCNHRVEYADGRKGSNLYVFGWHPSYLKEFKKAQTAISDKREEDREINNAFKRARTEEINDKKEQREVREKLIAHAKSLYDSLGEDVPILPHYVQVQPVDGLTQTLSPSHTDTTPVSVGHYLPSHTDTLTYNLNLECNQELNPARASAEGDAEVFEIQEEEEAGEPSSKAEEEAEAPAASRLERGPVQ